MTRRRFYPEFFILIILAVATRTWQLFSPNAVVFDEVYFKAFAGHYLDGRYFFDIHPPLGKLILAGWAHLCGLSGAQLATTSALPLRVIPAFFGILLVPLAYGIARRLGASRWLAFMAGFLVLADTALTVESRFILTDTTLLATGLGAIYAYLWSRDQSGWKRYLGIASSTLLAGASLSTKWTGLTSFALVFGIWFYDNQRVLFAKSWWRELVTLVIIPIALYISLFAVHFALLPSSGDGDAFMSTHFQSTLIGSTYYQSSARMSFAQKFVELNVEMFRANQTLTATHPYGSHWYSWPLELRPIYYWQGATLYNGNQGNIYLLGNPVIWWGSAFALLFGSIIALVRIKSFSRPQRLAIFFLLAAYLINYLPFAGVTRVMFLYHYFFSFIYGLLASILIWGWIIETSSLSAQQRKFIVIGIVSLASLGFLYFSPLTYGSPLSPTALQAHMWLKTWR